MDSIFENLWPEQETVLNEEFNQETSFLKTLHLDNSLSLYEVWFKDGSREKIEALTANDAILKTNNKPISKIKHILLCSLFSVKSDSLN